MVASLGSHPVSGLHVQSLCLIMFCRPILSSRGCPAGQSFRRFLRDNPSINCHARHSFHRLSCATILSSRGCPASHSFVSWLSCGTILRLVVTLILTHACIAQFARRHRLMSSDKRPCSARSERTRRVSPFGVMPGVSPECLSQARLWRNATGQSRHSGWVVATVGLQLENLWWFRRCF